MDQLVLERDASGNEHAIYNDLPDGPGGEVSHQGKIQMRRFVQRVNEAHRYQAEQTFGLVPRGVTMRGTYQRGGRIVVMIEVEPGTRTLRWLRDDSPAQYGSLATYRDVHISLPHMYFFVGIERESSYYTTTLCNSVYFANRAVTSLDDSLCDCHFFNCSVDAYGMHCWICTQHVRFRIDSPFGLAAKLVEWFFNSGFNASSEHYEDGSFWGKFRDEMEDERVRSIDAWEQATRIDAKFALSVPWRKSFSVKKVFKDLTHWQDSRPCNLGAYVKLVRQELE